MLDALIKIGIIAFGVLTILFVLEPSPKRKKKENIEQQRQKETQEGFEIFINSINVEPEALPDVLPETMAECLTAQDIIDIDRWELHKMMEVKR